MNTNKNLLVALALALALIAAVWLFARDGSHPLPIAEGDTASWDLQGTYEGNAELEARAKNEIARLEGLFGGDQSGKDDDPTDYILNVSIANQYELLGDGAKAYEYLGRAARIDPGTGLAWRNLGSLTERLGAFATARIAYAKAVEAQPQIAEYHLARLAFLTKHFAGETSAVEAAFGEAEAQFGDAPEIIQLKAQWHAGTGRIAEAIAAWERLKALVEDDGAIEREIARLRALL